MKRLAPLLVVAALAAQPACYGSYSAFHAVHRWNGHATGNRIVNSILHTAMVIIPVYAIVIFGDIIIFNNIEFVTQKPVFGGGDAAVGPVVAPGATVQ
jgi:hypothetical protein